MAIVDMAGALAALENPTFGPEPEPGDVVVSGRGKYTPRNRLNNLTGTEWVKATRSWFVHRPGPRGDLDQHPAKFPPGVAERFVRYFTKTGDWVLDPFAGTCSTLVACDRLRRNGLGVEVYPRWADAGARVTDQPILVADSTKDLARLAGLGAAGAFSFSVSSPPYWDMLNHSRGGSDSTAKSRGEQGLPETFGSGGSDIGNEGDYYRFLDKLLDAYDGVKLLLEPGAYCVVLLQNVMKPSQQFYPLAHEFFLWARSRGWWLRQEYVWCQREKRLGVWGYPYTYISNVHHHHCLVLQKPFDPETRSQRRAAAARSRRDMRDPPAIDPSEVECANRSAIEIDSPGYPGDPRPPRDADMGSFY